MYTELGHLKRAGSLENFYCIYELYPDDPHISGSSLDPSVRV
jgi:hypothetical protein